MTEQTQPTDAPLNVIELMKAVMQADEETRAFALRGTTNWAAHIGKVVQNAVLTKWGTPAGAGEVVAVVGTDSGGVHLYYEGKYLGPQPAKKTVMLLKDLPLGTQLFTTPQPSNSGSLPEMNEINDLQHARDHIEKCAVCGDGNARLLVMRNCDVCGSDYAGQSESEVNVALERARRATQEQAGAVPTRAFLERTLAAMEGVIDVADRKTDEFDALRSCVIDLTLMLFKPEQSGNTAPSAGLPREVIRDIFMAHGFTIKEGQTDLKQYVYDAADALLRAAHGIKGADHA